MAIRHKVPTVFNIYMLDVICCALGCVILLWQVSHHANENAIDLLDQKDVLLANKESQIASLSLENVGLKSSLAETAKQKVAILVEVDELRNMKAKADQLTLVLRKDFDDLKKTHALAESLLARTKIDLRELESKSTLTASELAAKMKAYDALLTKIAEAEGKVRILERDLNARDSAVAGASKEAKATASKLVDAEKLLASLNTEKVQSLNKVKVAELRITVLEQDLERLKGFEKDLVRFKTDAIDADRRLRDLLANLKNVDSKVSLTAKELEQAKAMIASLQSERSVLVDRARAMQLAADARFAGVPLTGSRVLFLVDMSGSMELSDENTADPDKWPLVCETVSKLMQSLPDLKQYQVILFSDRVRYPLGNDGRWLNYEGKENAEVAANRLKKIRPIGETNMFAAFEEAFRYRDHGLESIYVLSDGLPNAGEGLPASTANLSEQQKSEILGKHVRTRLKNDWNRAVAGQRVRINTVGFFFESPDVGAFLWALSRENGGSFVGTNR
ncbi:MAG: VWA domain-containing protein [Gemmataceae bacterium]|nr:VWA domain-containing protein [Gemmataceae bacterium]